MPPLGLQGVCGTAAEQGCTQVVADVAQCDNYIPCDDETRSLPLILNYRSEHTMVQVSTLFYFHSPMPKISRAPFTSHQNVRHYPASSVPCTHCGQERLIALALHAHHIASRSEIVVPVFRSPPGLRPLSDPSIMHAAPPCMRGAIGTRAHRIGTESARAHLRTIEHERGGYRRGKRREKQAASEASGEKSKRRGSEWGRWARYT